MATTIFDYFKLKPYEMHRNIITSSTAPDDHQSMDNEERLILEAREADPFYYFSIPGALKYDNVLNHDSAEKMLRYLSIADERPITRKTRVSCEMHPDEVLLPMLISHEFGESPADLAGIQADAARIMSELLGDAENSRRRSTEPARISSRMQDSDDGIYLKNRPRRNSFVCGDAPAAIKTQMARGA